MYKFVTIIKWELELLPSFHTVLKIKGFKDKKSQKMIRQWIMQITLKAQQLQEGFNKPKHKQDYDIAVTI